MSFRISDDMPSFFAQTYVSNAMLQKYLIPLAPHTTSNEFIGVIPKIIRLDPRVAKQFLAIDAKILSNRLHQLQPWVTPNNIIDKTSVRIDDADPIPLTTTESFLHDPLIASASKNYFGAIPNNDDLTLGRQMVLQNGGFLVRPTLSYDAILPTDATRYIQTNPRMFQGRDPQQAFDKTAMGGFDACAYRLSTGLSLANSTYTDFQRVLNINDSPLAHSLYTALHNNTPTSVIPRISVSPQEITINGNEALKQLLLPAEDPEMERTRHHILTQFGINDLSRVTITHDTDLLNIIQAKEQSLRDTQARLTRNKDRAKDAFSETELLEDIVTLQTNNRHDDALQRVRDLSTLYNISLPTDGDVTLITSAKNKLREIREEATRIEAQRSADEDSVRASMQEIDALRKQLPQAKASTLVQSLYKGYDTKAEKNRKDACKLVNALRSYQDRQGWRNMIVWSKANYNDMVQVKKWAYSPNTDAMNTAMREAHATINLLNVCNDTNTCDHSFDASDVGMHQPNNDVPPPSIDMFLVFPLQFWSNATTFRSKRDAVSKLIKAAHDLRIKHIDADNDVNYNTVTRVAKALNLPMLTTNASNPSIPFHLAPSSAIQAKGRELNTHENHPPQSRDVSVTRGEYQQFIQQYHSEMNKMVVAPDHPNIKSRYIQEFLNSNVRPYAFFSYDALGRFARNNPYDRSRLQVQPEARRSMRENEDVTPTYDAGFAGCLLDGGMKFDDALILLDGNNQPIQWMREVREDTGDVKHVPRRMGEIIDDLQAKYTNREREFADPKTWHWTCIENPLHDEETTSKVKTYIENEVKYGFTTVEQKRGVKMTLDNNNEYDVDRASFNDALKDLAIYANNAIVLGILANHDKYIDGSLHLLSPAKYSEIQDGSEARDAEASVITRRMANLNGDGKILENGVEWASLSHHLGNPASLLPYFGDKGQLLASNVPLLLQRRRNVTDRGINAFLPIKADLLTNNPQIREKIRDTAILGIATNFDHYQHF